jgi:hypothetical protein
VRRFIIDETAIKSLEDFACSLSENLFWSASKLIAYQA